MIGEDEVELADKGSSPIKASTCRRALDPASGGDDRRIGRGLVWPGCRLRPPSLQFIADWFAPAHANDRVNPPPANGQAQAPFLNAVSQTSFIALHHAHESPALRTCTQGWSGGIPVSASLRAKALSMIMVPRTVHRRPGFQQMNIDLACGQRAQTHSCRHVGWTTTRPTDPRSLASKPHLPRANTSTRVGRPRSPPSTNSSGYQQQFGQIGYQVSRPDG